ncbi:ATP-binding cassette domain-containing protein, partial [Clostridioides difficile]
MSPITNLEVGYYYSLLPKLNFSVDGGQKIVITGFNGIGKSTLLKT